MTCATHEQLARGEGHDDDCLACRRAREEQRAIQALLAQLPVPALSSRRRASLAAETMARADAQLPVRSRRPLVVAVGAALLAAAVVLVVVRDSRVLDRRIEARVAPAANAEPARTPDPVEVAPAPGSPEVVVADPPRVPPPLVDRGTPPPAPAKIDGTRHVFGATTAKQAAAIDRDTVDIAETPVVAFRRGWEALRAQRYADAIAAFDKATDPVVAEDAAFWSAIAAQRGGDLDDARKRFDSFLSRFPASPRADAARRAREVLR